MKTPLTDAASFSARDMNRIRVNVVPADFARRLESDRARLIEMLTSICDVLAPLPAKSGPALQAYHEAHALLRELGEST